MTSVLSCFGFYLYKNRDTLQLNLNAQNSGEGLSGRGARSEMGFSLKVSPAKQKRKWKEETINVVFVFTSFTFAPTPIPAVFSPLKHLPPVFAFLRCFSSCSCSSTSLNSINTFPDWYRFDGAICSLTPPRVDARRENYKTLSFKKWRVWSGTSAAGCLFIFFPLGDKINLFWLVKYMTGIPILFSLFAVRYIWLWSVIFSWNTAYFCSVLSLECFPLLWCLCSRLEIHLSILLALLLLVYKSVPGQTTK